MVCQSSPSPLVNTAGKTPATPILCPGAESDEGCQEQQGSSGVVDGADSESVGEVAAEDEAGHASTAR